MWIVNADGTGLMQVTTDGLALDAAWAPSGNRIALTKWNSSRTSMGVWVINADGTGARQITPPSLRASEPSWSPNGRWIAFTARKDSNNGTRSAVSIIRADGTGLQRLTPYEGNGEPCWSPDGSRIAFGSGRSGANKIWTMRADGTDVQQVTWLANTYDADCDWRTIP
jgi:Tol biopolymer transport system component